MPAGTNSKRGRAAFKSTSTASKPTSSSKPAVLIANSISMTKARTSCLSAVAATPKSRISCLSAGIDVKTLNNQSPVTCAACEEIIMDGNDSTVLCWLCDGWFHRHCAGLSLAHVDALSVFLDPFFCVECSQASYKK